MNYSNLTNLSYSRIAGENSPPTRQGIPHSFSQDLVNSPLDNQKLVSSLLRPSSNFTNSKNCTQPVDLSQNMTQIIESQVKNLSHKLTNVVQNLNQDETLQTMNLDQATQPFMTQRINEIFQKHLESEMKQLSTQIQHTLRNQSNNQIPFGDISNCAQNIRSQTVREDNHNIDQMNELKRQVQFFSSHSQYLQQQLEKMSDVRGQQDQMQMAKEYGEKIIKQSQEQINKVIEKFRNKNDLLREKVKEQKQTIQDLYHEKDHLLRQLQENQQQIQIIQDEANQQKYILNQKLNEIDHSYQLRISELTATHQFQISQLQKEFQTLMEQKLQEIQQKHNQTLSNNQQENHDLKLTISHKIKQLEKEYIKIEDHEKVVNQEVQELNKKHKTQLNKIKEQIREEVEDEFRQQLNAKQKETERSSQAHQCLVDELNNANYELKRQNRDLNDQLEEQQWTIDKNKRVLQTKEEEIQQLVDDIHQMRVQLEEMTQIAQNIELNSKDRIESLEEEQEQLKSENQELRFKLDELQSQLDAQEKDLKEQDEKIQQQSQDLKEKDQIIDDLNTQFSEYQKSIEQLQTLLQQQENEKSEQLTREEELQEDIQQLEDQVQTLSKFIQILQGNIQEKIELQVKPLTLHIAQLRIDFTNQQSLFNNEINQAMQVIKNLQNVLYKKNSTNSQKINQMRDMQESQKLLIDQYEDKIAEMKNEIQRLEYQNGDLVKENKQMKQVGKEVESKYEDLKERFDQIMNGYTQLRSTYEVKVEKLKSQQFETLTFELQSLQEKHKQEMKQMKEFVEKLKQKYANQIQALNNQLDNLQELFGQEYKSVNSKYESEYDSLRCHLFQEKAKIEQTKSQIAELIRQKEQDQDLFDIYKQEKQKEFQTLQQQIRELMASLEESRRENKELKFYQNEINQKYKKKYHLLKKTLKEKETEIGELQEMLKNQLQIINKSVLTSCQVDESPRFGDKLDVQYKSRQSQALKEQSSLKLRDLYRSEYQAIDKSSRKRSTSRSKSQKKNNKSRATSVERVRSVKFQKPEKDFQ